jgi:threonine/homoserine/homoserine lactone efflux protein
MSIYDWLTISLICVAGATTPGPSLLVIVYINNREGMISGIIASIAHGIGIFIYALISIYAISFINKNLPTITPILQLIGALFLIFISYKMIIFKSSQNIFQNNLQLSKKYSGSFLLGLTTSIINPKILIFLTSVFSQFINDEFNNYTKIGIGLLAGVIDAVWYILVSYSVNLKKLRDYIILKQKLVYFIFGIILISISIYLAHVSIRYFI